MGKERDKMIYPDELKSNLKRLKDYSIYEREFNKFYQAHEKIIIFGTGWVSALVTRYFECRNLKFEFYCATRKSRKKEWIKNNDQIKVFDEIRDTIDDSYGIILAMRESNVREAAEYLCLRKVTNNVFICPEFLYYLALYVYHNNFAKVIMEDDSLKSIGGCRLREDTFYIACPYGIGDTLGVASLVHAFKKENRVDRVCLIIKKGQGDLPNLFDSVDDKIVSDELVAICKDFSIFSGIRKCQNYLYGHIVVEKIQYYIFTDTLLSHYKELMCIDERSERERATFVRSNSLDIYQNSVILMPHANTSKMLPISFWEKLAGKLVENGYVVYTNIKDETEYVISGTYAISKPLPDIPSFAEKCSLVIALRSGICDLLAFSKTKMIVIVPTWFSFYDKPEFDDITDSVKRVSFDPKRDDEENIMMVLKSANLLLGGQ